MFSVIIFDQPIDVLSFLFKHLRVEASRVLTGVSFHNFRAEYLNPFLHVPYLVLRFEDHGSSLFHIFECTDLGSSLPPKTFRA